MASDINRKVLLEDGSEYNGSAFGDTDGERVCEIVFNTSMVGYQEIVSDPSYTYQAVVMTYPLIGNYGTADEDFETGRPTIGALIVREYNDMPSNCRSTAALGDVMKKYGIAGVYGVDTRKLTRSIRDYGSRKALITAASTPREIGLQKLARMEVPRDAVAKVSCTTPWQAPAWQAPAWPARFHVVAVDCGIKLNIIRSLSKSGCKVTVVPWNTSAEEIERLHPDGICLSNGPGDPMDAVPVINLVKQLRGSYPIFGICLGHQIIALAYGAKTYKLKFGHRGGNHPVRNLLTGKVEITSQNHSYAVDADSIRGDLAVTHVNLLDATVEGLRCEADMVLSVQYHPESAPGPQDSGYLFDCFVELMEADSRRAKTNRH
jgi:carbamoyl-phosphate synthase small subunit